MVETQCGFDDTPAIRAGDLLVAFGPGLVVQIGFDPSFRPGGGSDPNFAGTQGYPALIDTGATASCIDSGLAMQLNLPVVDRQMVAGISGSREANMHLAQIYLQSMGFTVYGVFAGVDLQAGGQPHFALLGRTFL